jgi:hypothetical protein
MPGGHFKAPTLSLSGEKSAQYLDNIFIEALPRCRAARQSLGACPSDIARCRIVQILAAASLQAVNVNEEFDVGQL